MLYIKLKIHNYQFCTHNSFFIFKSTWDYEYHLEVNKPQLSSVPTLQSIYQTLYVQSIVKKFNVENKIELEKFKRVHSN